VDDTYVSTKDNISFAEGNKQRHGNPADAMREDARKFEEDAKRFQKTAKKIMSMPSRNRSLKCQF